MSLRAAALSSILALALSPALRAHDAHQQHAAPAAAEAGAVKVALSDAPLLDASGKRVRLAPDVIAGRIAVVNFVYTSCATVCPLSSASFEQLQKRLAPALGKDVVLVSVSIDPVRDTPSRLSEYSTRYHAGAGWTWLTGAKADVDSALKGFGAYTPNFEDHPGMVLVGDARAGRWTRLFGFPSVDELAGRVEALRAERARDALAHHQQGKE